MSHTRLTLPFTAAAVITAAGWVSLLATYWDDAWHTDVGRDSAWTAPHVALYGAVAVAGLVVCWWGLASVIRAQSIFTVIRWPSLLLAGAGGATVLAAAPVDAAWHAAYGRDAVLWSPPHMLAVFGSTAMLTGVLAGLPWARPRLLEAALSGLLLGSFAVAVMEYESDVPQFSEKAYLPVLLTAGLLAVALARTLVPRPWTVTSMVAAYVIFRLATIGVLAALGRSTPALPIAICGLAAADLPRLRPAARCAAAAATVSVLAWAAAAAGLAPQSPAAVSTIAAPVIAVSAAVLVASAARGRLSGAVVVAAAISLLLLATAQPALAHDPGEGTELTTARLALTRDGHGGMRLTVTPGTRCGQLKPRDITARRAGITIRAPLTVVGACQFTGTITLPDSGRWFIYADFTDSGHAAETWLPAYPEQATATETRLVYRPAQAKTSAARHTQTAAGAVIYAVGLGLLGCALLVARRNTRNRAHPPDRPADQD